MLNSSDQTVPQSEAKGRGFHPPQKTYKGSTSDNVLNEALEAGMGAAKEVYNEALTVKMEKAEAAYKKVLKKKKMSTVVYNEALTVKMEEAEAAYKSEVGDDMWKYVVLVFERAVIIFFAQHRGTSTVKALAMARLLAFGYRKPGSVWTIVRKSSKNGDLDTYRPEKPKEMSRRITEATRKRFGTEFAVTKINKVLGPVMKGLSNKKKSVRIGSRRQASPRPKS